MDLLQKIKIGEKIDENINELNQQVHQNKFFDNLELIPYPVAYISKDECYEYANKAYLAWYDTDYPQLVGKKIQEFLGPANYDHIKIYIGKVLSGEKIDFETEIQYKKYENRFIRAYYNPEFDAEGKVKGYLALIFDITDQKRIEQGLLQSEDRYRNLIHSLPAAIYTTDKDGFINLYNEAAVELWGETPEIGKEKWCGSSKIYETDGITRLHHDATPMAIALKERCKVNDREIIIEKSDGTKVYIQPYSEPIFDSRGNITGGVNLLMNITERKISEEQRAKLAAIVQSSDDAIIGKTLEGIVTSWNSAAERIFGYTAEEMVGQSITKIIPSERLDEEPRILEKLKKGEHIDHFETERITKDGKLIFVLLTISPVKDRHGNVIGVSKIARNITERRKAEEINAKLAAIVQSSDDAIIGKTMDGTITSWNHAAERLFGYREEEIIGQPITKIIPADRLQEETEILNKLRTGESVSHFETKRITKDGRLLDISLTVSPIKDKNGVVIGVSKIARDVTLQKESERMVHENQERFRMAVETTSLGTWEYNMKDLKLYCSPESLKICGLPYGLDPDFELLFRQIFQEDKEYFLQQVKHAIDPAAGDGNLDLLLRFYRYDDHEMRWIRAQGKVFFNSSLSPERLIGTMLDITEEKTREEELKESVELFQTMADNVPAMIWMSGTDKFDDYFNKTWLEFTGRTLEQESNEGWLGGVHPDDVEMCIDTYNKSFKEQKGFYTEYRLRRYDGEYRWISDNSVPRFSAEGEFLGFISACVDIDDQKRFREKIQESELLFKTISNASPAALWMTNENEEDIFVSDTWLKWTGKSINEIIHRGWIQSVLKEDREQLTNKFRECFRLRKYLRSDFRFKKADGEIRWGLTEGYPFFDFNGSFSGFAGSITDITEIKKLEQRKDDFIKMASHELKTPITSINGYVQLLLNIYNEVDEQKIQLSKPTIRSSLNTISKQIAKLTRLVSELLDLSKLESGKLELHKTEFDLSDLVNETVQDVRLTVSKHSIIVHNHFEGKMFADKDRIGQVILNILTNAIKYSPKGDRVEVFVDGDEKLVNIRIKDYGIGIDKKDQAKIFERFFRAEGKSEQTFPGFGIGLFIASEIIHRHHGTISVTSEKAKGSEFTITLPLRARI